MRRTQLLATAFGLISLLTGCGAQPIYWHASSAYLPAGQAQDDDGQTIILRTEGLQAHVSAPSDDKRTPWITFEYQPGVVLDAAWQPTIRQWRGQVGLEKAQCLREYTLIVKRLSVRHNEAGVGLGYNVPRIWIEITIDLISREGQKLASDATYSGDVIGKSYSIFTNDNESRSEIFSGLAYAALQQTLISALNDARDRATSQSRGCT